MNRIVLGFICALWLFAPAWGQGLPNVDTQGLAAEEASALSTLFREGACPCDTRISLYDCLVAKTCPQAQSLAAYGVAKFREGLGIDDVGEAVVKKYMNDHLRYEFDLRSAPKKGAANPAIHIVEFADFECPFCAEMRLILEEIVKAHPNEVAIYFKQFPLSHHLHSLSAARASLAAGRQGRFWQMHDLLFLNQARLNDEKMIQFARELGLNTDKFQQDWADTNLLAQVESDRQEAIKANISSTPTLYINGQMYIEGKSPTEIKAFVSNLVAELKTGKGSAKKPAVKNEKKTRKTD